MATLTDSRQTHYAALTYRCRSVTPSGGHRQGLGSSLKADGAFFTLSCCVYNFHLNNSGALWVTPLIPPSAGVAGIVSMNSSSVNQVEVNISYKVTWFTLRFTVRRWLCFGSQANGGRFFWLQVSKFNKERICDQKLFWTFDLV